MTAQSRATLKSKFENGDVPTGEDFGDLIDSFVSLTETSAQNIAGNVQFSSNVCAANLFTASFVATSVEASTGTFTGPVTVSSLTVNNTASVSVFRADSVSANNATFNGIVTASTLVVPNTATLSAVQAQSVTTSALAAQTIAVSGTATFNAGMTVSGAVRRNVAFVTAAGTTQGSAQVMGGAGVYRVVLATAAQNVGVMAPVSASGQTVMMANETAVNLTLWPQTGGKINGGTVNGSITVTASTAVVLWGATELDWWAFRSS